MRRVLPTSLTGRLIAALVLLVVLATAMVALVTTLAMRSYLYGQQDHDVQSALNRSVGGYRLGLPGGSDGDRDGPGGRFGLGDASGTLSAEFDPDVPDGRGSVIAMSGRSVATTDDSIRPLSSTALGILRRVPRDGRVHEVDLPAVGSYRVKVAEASPVRIVAGTSTRKVDAAVAQLVLWEVLLALLAAALAVLLGRWIVRRQLRPLRDVAATAHEVSALPLSSGAIGTTVRVPEDLTDERTEVGSVGAALNTLLEHVEHALDERHRSEQQVRQFVADASHELRTPLTTIHGYAELSRRTRPSDPAQLELAMGKVEAEAVRMSSLVEDLLLLARLDSGRPLARDEVDLTRLVLETVGDARVVGPDHRWLLDLSDEPVTVTGDEQRLHQVVTNLLNNARRHTPPGTSIRVGVHLHDGPGTDPGNGTGDGPGNGPGNGSVVISVQDDGPGMAPELVPTAFERFTRGDSSRTRESGGAGLGLSLVQAITTAHGGHVSVTSERGRTRFEVRLPADPAPVSARVPDPATTG